MLESHISYVLAAYGVTAGGLIGLVATFIIQWHKTQRTIRPAPSSL